MDIEVQGKVGDKYTYVNYKLKIDDNFLKSKDALQLVVRPFGVDERFSDPDIYASTTEKYPTTEANKHEWYSENFGMDILTIEPEELKNAKFLYVAITCENGNCPFILKAQYESQIEIETDKQIAMRLQKNQDTIFNFKVHKKTSTKNINLLQVSVWSPNFAEYSVIMQKNKGPTSTKSIKFSPAWIGASTALLRDEEICGDECEYHLLIYPKSDNAIFILNIDTGTDFFEFKYGSMAFAVAPSYQTVCHRKLIGENEKKIVVSSMLFSGMGKLYINPSETIPQELGTSKFVYEFKDEIIFAKDKKELGITSNPGYLMFCFQSYYYTSTYTLNIYDESDANHQQLNNVLFNGLTIPGYLPKKSNTKFSIIDAEKFSNITVSYEIIKGEANVYGYICSFDCIIDNKFINRLKNKFYKSELLPTEISTGTDSSQPGSDGKNQTTPYVVRFPGKENICELTKSSYNCLPIIIIDCIGEEECIFKMTAKYGHSFVELKNSKPHHNVINYGAEDFYYFNIQEDIDRLTVIVNSMSGDADLYLSRKNKKPGPLDFEFSSLQEVFTPDVITLEKNENRPSLKGDYYVGVYAESFTSYSILYYTKTNEDKNKGNSTDNHVNTEHVGIELKNGVPAKGFLANGEYFRVFELDKIVNDDDVKFFLTSLKLPVDLYIYTASDFIDFFKPQKGVEQGFDPVEMFTKYKWRSEPGENEVIIKKNDPNYRRDGIYYAIVCRRYNDVDTNSTFYLTGVESGYPVVLQDSVPEIITLKKEFESQQFLVFLYKGQNTTTINVNTIYGKVNLNTYGDKNTTIKCGSFCKTQLSFDTYCTDSVESCSVLVVVERRKKDEAQFSIVKKDGDSNAPEYLHLGYSKQDSIFEGDTHYYMYNIEGKKNSSYVYFTFEEGVVDVIARLVTYNSTKYSFPEDYGETELFDVEYTFRGGRAIPLYHINMTNCFLDPKNPSPNNSLDCVLLITVKGAFSFSKDKSIYYKIDYSGFPYYVSTDSPIYGEVSFSEYDLFKFDVPEDIEYFSISLSHVTSSSTLLLNKGKEIPINDPDWVIGDWRPQILEITSNDSTIKFKNEKVGGKYTGAVYAPEGTTYNLYINTHSKKVEEVDEYSVSKCQIKAGEYCYYTYFYSLYDILFDDLFSNDVEKSYKDLIMISHIDYTYGDAVIYARLVNEDIDTYDDKLPTDLIYDASSKDQNSRNFLKLIVDKNDKRLKNNKIEGKNETSTTPIVLFSIKCLNDCDFDFKVREVRDNFLYLDTTRENLVYVPKNNKSFLQYYVYDWNYVWDPRSNSNENNKLNQQLQFNLLSGGATITLKQFDNLDNLYNFVYYDDYGNPIKKDENEAHGLDFLLSKGKNIDHINLYNENKNWILNIPEDSIDKYIVAIVETKEEEVGFSVKLKEKKSWERLNFKFVNLIEGESPIASFQTKYLYLELHEKYSNVTLNLKSDYNTTNIDVFGKYFIIPKDTKTSKPQSFDSLIENIAAPGIESQDFNSTNNRAGMSYINIPKHEKEDYDKNRVFVILSVQVNMTLSKENKNLASASTPLLSVNVEKFEEKTEGFNTWSIDLFEFDKFTDIVSDGEAKIFKMSNSHYEEGERNKLQIHIDRCDDSELKFFLSEEIIFDFNSIQELKKKKLEFHLETRDSRYLIKADASKQDYFLVVWKTKDEESSESSSSKSLDNINDIDDQVAFYMIQYSFINSSNEIKKTGKSSIWSTNPSLVYTVSGQSATINYEIPQIVKVPSNPDARFKLFISESKTEFKSFHSLCYLNSVVEKHAFYDKTIGKFTFNLHGPGKYYIGLTVEYDGDSFVYNPTEIQITKGLSSVSWPIIIIGVLIMTVLLIVAYIYYKKYTQTKSQLDYEVTDVRNMATTGTMKVEEMKEVHKTRSKYANLTDNSANI